MSYKVHTNDSNIIDYFVTLRISDVFGKVTPGPSVQVTRWLDETVGAGNWSFKWISPPKNPCNEIDLRKPDVEEIVKSGGIFYFDKEEDKLLFVFRWLATVDENSIFWHPV